jgi:F-type H+-transporting ATPase subunit b
VNINLTLIGQLVAFIVFVWFCMKYVWPPLISAIEERQKRIADGLADADKATKRLEQAEEKAKEQLKIAKQQASEIIEQANRRKNQIIEEAQVEARAEREKILTQGKAELEAERNRAKEELRHQVATLALSGAERILERSIDKAANADILEKLAQEL